MSALSILHLHISLIWIIEIYFLKFFIFFSLFISLKEDAFTRADLQGTLRLKTVIAVKHVKIELNKILVEQRLLQTSYRIDNYKMNYKRKDKRIKK